jgi:hypothetical protein
LFGSCAVLTLSSGFRIFTCGVNVEDTPTGRGSRVTEDGIAGFVGPATVPDALAERRVSASASNRSMSAPDNAILRRSGEASNCVQVKKVQRSQASTTKFWWGNQEQDLPTLHLCLKSKAFTSHHPFKSGGDLTTHRVRLVQKNALAACRLGYGQHSAPQPFSSQCGGLMPDLILADRCLHKTHFVVISSLLP